MNDNDGDCDDVVVPYSLLAFAKDHRYIRQLQDILQSIFVSSIDVNEGDNVDDDDGNNENQLSRTDAVGNFSWWTAALLYATLVVVGHKGRRTLGMEFVGLHCSPDTHAVSSSSSSSRRSIKPAKQYVFLIAAWAVWARHCVLLLKNHHSVRDDNGTEHHARQRRLRGLARRSFHEQQRRAMLQRAGEVATMAAHDDSDVSNTAPPNNMTSRTAMNGLNPSIVGAMNQQFESRNALRGKLLRVAKRFAEILAEALSSSSDNPHALPPDTPNYAARLLSIGRWIARLHVAHYCITGRWYPNLLWHTMLSCSRRVTSANATAAHQLEVDDSSSQPPPPQPPPPNTHGLVGRLILIQAGAIATKSLSRWIVSYITRQRRATLLPAGDTNDNDDNIDDSTLSATNTDGSNAAAAMLFENTSGAGSSSNTISYNDTTTRRGGQQAAALCAICRMPRVHSAVPSYCGHVLCWKCLYQWVSTVRPECPLCRAPCRPQDVLALSNYSM